MPTGGAVWQARVPAFRLMGESPRGELDPRSLRHLALRLQDLLLCGLLLNQPHSHRPSRRCGMRSDPRHLRRACEFMLEHLEEPLGLLAVGQTVGRRA